jgi:putative acetyltransferase
MRLRTFRKEDEIPVKKLVTEVLAEFGWKPDPKYDPDFNDLSAFYSGEKDNFFILEDKGQIIGTVAIKSRGKGRAELRKLFLKKDYRGKGLGEKLIDKALEFCQKNRFRTLDILTDGGLIQAISLYKKKGFKVVKKHKNGDFELRLIL